MSAAPNSVPAEEQFDWIQLSEALQDPNAETFTEKLWRKTKANPFVPIGAFGAAGALTFGLWSMKNNDPKMSQMMMRVRIGAQAFAITAMVIGLITANPAVKKTDE